MPITSNNLQTTRSETAATSYSLSSYAVSPGSNRMLVVRVHAMRTSEADFTLSATFNSVSMSEAVTVTRSGSSRWWRTTIFYLIAPDETTADVVVSSSATLAGIIIAGETLHGAAQASPIGAIDTDSVSAADVALTLTGCASNSWIFAAASSNSGGPPSWSWSGATENYDLASAGSDTSEVAGSGAAVETSGGDVSITATRSGSANHHIAVGAEIKAAATGGLVVPIFSHYYRQLATV